MSGIWIAVDVGSVRVGVARSDPDGVLALPVATLARDGAGDSDISELASLIAEYEAVGVVVGLPRTLRGEERQAAGLARAYGAKLASVIAPVPVEYLDERLTTVSATRKLATGSLRGSKAKRAVIDQAAAVELLQHWLDRTDD